MQNKFNSKILLVIIIVLLFGGLGYIILNNSKQKENSISNENIFVKTYKSINAGYLINYPQNWELPQKFETQYSSSFIVKNKDFSTVSILVNFSLPFDQTKSYVDYKSIDDYIKDYKISGTPQVSIQGDLNKISTMNIGGKLLRVQSMKAVDGPNGSVNDSYIFIYNSKYYAIEFVSINKAQYDIDSKVFNELLSSFVLDDIISPSDKNIIEYKNDNSANINSCNKLSKNFDLIIDSSNFVECDGWNVNNQNPIWVGGKLINISKIYVDSYKRNEFTLAFQGYKKQGNLYIGTKNEIIPYEIGKFYKFDLGNRCKIVRSMASSRMFSDPDLKELKELKQCN